MNRLESWPGWIAALIWALVEKSSPKGEPACPLPAEIYAWNFHVQQLNEHSAMYQDDQWVLGIEDFVEPSENR